jgi:hypothetical protein
MQKFVPNTSEKKILFSSIVAAFEGKGKAVQLIDTLTTLDMEQISTRFFVPTYVHFSRNLFREFMRVRTLRREF